MFRSAVGNEAAAEQFRDFVQARLVDGIGPRLSTPTDAAVRAGLASAMLVGIVIARRIIQIDALTEVDHEKIVGLVATLLQSLLWPRVRDHPSAERKPRSGGTLDRLSRSVDGCRSMAVRGGVDGDPMS